MSNNGHMLLKNEPNLYFTLLRQVTMETPVERDRAAAAAVSTGGSGAAGGGRSEAEGVIVALLGKNSPKVDRGKQEGCVPDPSAAAAALSGL